MSIGLTDAEEAYITSQASTTGELVSYLEIINESILALQTSKPNLKLQSDSYKKFYDYFTTITDYGVLEKKWLYGDYDSEEITETIITNSAGNDTTILFPVDHYYNYPKRLDILNGTDSSGFGDAVGPPLVYGLYEYGQIIEEQSEPVTALKQPFINAQITTLNTYVIPNLTAAIMEMQSETARYGFLGTLITQAQASLAYASIALTNAQAAIAEFPSYPATRATYLTTRSSEISTRISQITTTYMDAYDERYVWLDLRLNKAYGGHGDYLAVDDFIAARQVERTAVQQQIDSFNNYIG